MRVLGVLLCAAAPVLALTAAKAETACRYIKQAEAVGVVVDKGSLALAAINWGGEPTAAPVFAAQSKQISPGDTVSALLNRSGLMADKYNLTIAKALNPGIADLNNLKIGELVRIPAVDSDDGGMPQLDGYRTWPKVAHAWGENASLDVANTLPADAVARFSEQPGWKDFEAASKELAGGMTPSRDASVFPVLDGTDFSRLESNVAAAQTVQFLQELVQSNDPVITDPTNGAFAVVAEASVKMSMALGAGRTNLVVRTVSPTNEELPNLRVFRVSEASHQLHCQEENKVEFDSRSSPATAVLPTAKWWMWAEDASGRKSVPREVPLVGPEMKIDYTVEWTGG